MRSENQQQASRENGGKSRGPKTPESKKKSSMNNLKHGLRSNQVVLPGESVAEFQAELKGWKDDWRPRGHTTAVIVERAAVASWRLRRCVRAGSDLLMELAERTAARKRRRDGNDDDDSPEGRLEKAETLLAFNPVGSLAELRSTPEGVDRLLARWAELAKAIAGGNSMWDYDERYDIMILFFHQGEYDDDDASAAVAAGPLAVDSHRLSNSNICKYRADKLPSAEADAVAARIGAGIARERAALVELRRDLVARGPDDEADDDSDADYRFAGVTNKIMLIHRYEMAHERSMRAVLRDLVMLEKVRPELGRAADFTTERVVVKKVKKTDSEASAGSEAGGSAAPDEPEAGVASGGLEGLRQVRGGRRRRSRRSRKARSRR